jgi:DNA-binding transcriptional ArsR family regulator
MRGEPEIASVAALIGDPSRAAMLSALADGRALSAGELASIAGLSLSGASAHLARLAQGGLIIAEQQGRHRYYRLTGSQVAAALESLAPLAITSGRPRVVSPAMEALRRGRTCYDHLAGELGVAFADALERRGYLVPGEGKRLEVTVSGKQWLAETLDIEITSLRPGRHGIACRCLDWTERRPHIGGPLGTALLQRCRMSGWVDAIDAKSRAVKLTRSGVAWVRETLGIAVTPGSVVSR